MSTGASTQARDTVSKAFERFQSTVTPEHARNFNNTTLKDVRDAARQIEAELAARQSLKNMKRLYSFFQGIECYSKSIEVLCNGTPYLPWVWAPVKLMLQLSMDYVDALDKLIDAYRKIADSLPSLDRLSSALKDNHDFQAVLADLYGDILEFHRYAYKFVTRRCSCDWILDCKEIQAWLKDKPSNGVMWLHGKPGAGKSVICANMIRSMQDQGSKVFYYLCSYQDNATETHFRILRSIAAQIIQSNPDLAEYVHDKYVITRTTQTQSKFKDLLTDLLSGIPSSRLVIDGIDECEPEEQKFIIQEFSRLTSQGGSAHICKVLFSSRDIPTVSRHLRTKKSKASELPLAREEIAVRAAIKSVVDKRLLDLQDDWDEIDPDPEIVKRVKHELVEKANGMFLWVHLVLSSFEDICSIHDLLENVRNLPSGLPEM
ncbi:uncharacterized protein LTHEOB_4249 [Lasiodiplodia theobromae]|uniref:uncharacterized protein n=1 Tax=Lasiodiplodia theobromae TaxID=45133 RepID=UPI0015C3ABAA|nr:uncharacterized protein LTHEOB_4249 [Lasiodiplodia theobromae]KAF4546252.1 hypothetical protein LTHEOB_4249 [Lasiodiplodia theobromae]